MRKRIGLVAVATGVAALLPFIAGMGNATTAKVAAPKPTTTAQPGPNVQDTSDITGHNSINPNHSFQSSFSFTPGGLTVTRAFGEKSKIAIHNTTGAPHTLTIVPKSALPVAWKDVKACWKKGWCGKALAAHQRGHKPNVEAQKDGHPELDRAGDSRWLQPHQTRVLKVGSFTTGLPGHTLYFVCAIHPWMEGSITIK